MVIEPKIRGFICTTAHPVGCRAEVKRQIDYVKSQPAVSGPKKVLVLGCSTGYGLSSRIAAAFGCGAATLGVAFERPAAGKRTATAGWYNCAAFEEFAAADGLYAQTINGDAFSPQIKEETIARIRRDLGQVDMVIYSLAAPRRTVGEVTYSSVLKTTGEPYTNKTIDLKTRQVSEITIPQATEQEIADTVKVMGGEDWMDWMLQLQNAGVLAPGATTVAYSYIGPALTHPMYLNGSIGQAKKHLYQTAGQIAAQIPGVHSYVSVNKALVTQSSAAIPIVPLYVSILYKVMKEKDLHEGCARQMYRLFSQKLFGAAPQTDEQGYLRLDDLEMRPDVQEQVSLIWEQLNSQNVSQLADIDGYWDDFYRMFGFGIEGVDYKQDVDPDVAIPSIHS
ncbi:trans-2-enoyl-CoA reductase family protein [Neobittarella massiliensis]|uniref:Trans-2-enoyl-CoA reductase [NADH] n=1 Tax=Neobittarella massiliensis (ex Bilen et al. 2018) TaxID=2041842 RepID=A0A8J6IED6_9FIRM|nr:enoyl-ACP reductase FabV [Neobittarella massiliensis]MBC3515645.1 trans-2-enoyl-CoA reductase family protein [Neobittarella massiliensis]